MIAECRQGLAAVLPMTADEIAFLDAILDHGRIEPERLTSDADMATRITTHPWLLWKALNVGEHKAK